jgi:hypothetical protein
MPVGSLISIGDVEGVFNDSVVTTLAEDLQVSTNERPRFAQSVRLDARLFLEAKARANYPALRAAIERLYQLVTRAERGSDLEVRRLIRGIEGTSADVWDWLNLGKLKRYAVPAAEEFLTPQKRQSAIEGLRRFLSIGGSIVEGRKRLGGKRSRSFKPLLRIPANMKSGRQRGQAERDFVRWLSLTYMEATGKPPPKTVNYNEAIRGPFSRFVHRCFELLGAPSGSVTELINERGNIHRGKPPGSEANAAGEPWRNKRAVT